jgi:hypothetical protein
MNRSNKLESYIIYGLKGMSVTNFFGPFLSYKENEVFLIQHHVSVFTTIYFLLKLRIGPKKLEPLSLASLSNLV